jgi:hypothetical protein
MIPENMSIVEKAEFNKLRDYFAAQAMKSEIIAWNSPIPDDHREIILQDWERRFGDKTVNEFIALSSYEMADAMMSVKYAKIESCLNEII